MPELPEVQTVVNTLRPLLVGRAVVRVPHVREDIVSPAGTDLVARMTRRRVTQVERRAKRIVLTLDDGNRLYFHLGMTGRLTIVAPGVKPLKHTHFILLLDNARQLHFTDARRFGGVFWLGQDDHVALGPEPLRLKPNHLARQLAKTRRAIKTALLDQRLIAGIGNIYADETLFRAGVHPLRPACEIDAEAVRRINAALKRVLNRAIRAGGSSISDYVDASGQRGSFQTLHRVYDRAGAPCRSCRTLIVRIVVGGRSTHFCPTCQRAD